MDKAFNLKPGVIWQGMNSAFAEDLSRWISVAEFIKDLCGGVPAVTSAKDSTHSINSLHYRGEAVDIRINDWKGVDVTQAAKTIAWLLGAKWVVVLELSKQHIHIQLGTSNIVNPSAIIKCGKGRFLK